MTNRTSLLYYLIFSLIAGSALASDDNMYRAEQGTFFAPRSWYQIEGDAGRNLFRGYALFFIDHKPVDLPNLFLMNCPANAAPYMTMRFPKHYVLKGFDTNTWLPKTDVFVRIEGSTFRFEAELVDHEFHIDLQDLEFDYFTEIWSSDREVEWKLGPDAADVALSLSNSFEEPIADLLTTRANKTATYSFLEMRTRCHAASLAGTHSPGWMIFGSLSCSSCDLTEDHKTHLFIKIGHEDGSSISNINKCKNIRTDIENEIQKSSLTMQDDSKIVTDLLCIGDGKWH